MRDGRFVEIGTPDELYFSPKSAFTARLIGGANIFEGVAAPAPDGGTLVETQFGRLVSADMATGQVQVFLRPDKIALAAGPAPSKNILRCQVRERRFAGESTELDLVAETGGTQLLRCRVPTSRAGVVPGDAVQVAIDPADIRIFPAESN